MKKAPLAEFRGVSKGFGKKLALDNVTLTIGRGKVIGLLGPNGSGKTTLIKLLNGLIRPTKGEILIDGVRPGIYTKSIVSYLPDRGYFADWMHVKDVLDMFEEFYNDFDRCKAEEMCAAMGISASDRIKTMSKGTREKVQLIINNYNEDGTVIISTHLISDIERECLTRRYSSMTAEWRDMRRSTISRKEKENR